MENWMADYLNEIHKYDGFDAYIYGAGNAGKIILKICRENGIRVSGFCVTNSADNVSEIDNVKVWQFNKLQFDPESSPNLCVNCLQV